MFILIPHIVRGLDVSHSGSDMLDVGTANALSLRRTSVRTAPPTPASSAGNVAPSPATPQGIPQAQPSANQIPPTQAGAGTGTFMFDPPTLTQTKGSTFTVNVMLSGGQNVYSVPVQLNYDPNLVQVINVSNGGFLSQDGQAVALVHRDDPATGTLQVTATRPPGAGGVSGQGAVVTLTFMAKGAGQSALTITRGGARDPAMQPIATERSAGGHYDSMSSSQFPVPVQFSVRTGAAELRTGNRKLGTEYSIYAPTTRVYPDRVDRRDGHHGHPGGDGVSGL